MKTPRIFFYTVLCITLVFAFISIAAAEDVIPGSTDMKSSAILEETATADDSLMSPLFFGISASVPVPTSGGYDYYSTYRFASLTGNNWVSAMRIVAQQANTTYYLDTNNDGIADYTGVLNAGGMYEIDVPTGAHLYTDKPVTVNQYDDYQWDWEDVYLPPTSEWGVDYWYAGMKSYGLGTDYLFFTAMTNGTVVNVDLNNDGTPDKTYTINKGGVASYSAAEVSGGSSVGKDPRAGAHITSNYPIQVHVFATMTAYFGSAYTLLPTKALGQNYYVPFIRAQNPTGWDVSDRILIVASENNTTVNIDENNDGVPEHTATLNKGATLEHPTSDKTTPFLMGTNVTSDKPIGVVYTSPRGMQHWDGGAVQLVPEKASLKEYWNTISWNTIKYVKPPYTLANRGWPGEPDIIMFAFQDNTVINIDTNNDGTPEKTYTLNKGSNVVHKLTKAGEHIYSDKPFSLLQTWYTTASAEIEQVGFRSNQPPVANAGPDQTIECTGPNGSPATLNGSASYDPDGDTLTYTWKEGDVILGTGVTLTVTLALGDHNITLTVDDGRGDTSTDYVMIAIQDTTPPSTSVASIAGIPGDNGWYKSDVLITLSSSDTCSGVREIRYTVDGMETAVAGDTALVGISAEGEHAVTYFAVDNASNIETAHPLSVKIDKTQPVITASVSPAPNSAGWHNTDVTVTFTCSDAVSGISFCPEPITVTTEGPDQEIAGAAVDMAGNAATTAVILNIDKTPPALSLSVNPGMLWPPNHKMVTVTPSITVEDANPGTTVVLVSVTSSEPDDGLGDGDTANDIVINTDGTVSLRAERSGMGMGRVYTFTYTATDIAGNSTTASATVAVPHDMSAK